MVAPGGSRRESGMRCSHFGHDCREDARHCALCGGTLALACSSCGASAKLGDFGLALAVDRTRLTEEGALKGVAEPQQLHAIRWNA